MNKNGIVVLSLFDGMSGAQIALNRLGVKIDKYYASEIDKYATAVTQYNYPDTVQLGDVTKWRDWDIDWGSVDMVIGGSPCQGLSQSGKGEGLKDVRSKLFFEWVDIRDHTKRHNPNTVFLLENVVPRKKEWADNMTVHVNVEPIKINSSLLSAQSRKRMYWTNIVDVQQPDDKNIYLMDIIESGLTDSIKSYCIDANYFKGGNLKQYFEKSRRQLVFDTPAMGTDLYVTGAAERVRYDDNGDSFIKTELRDDGKSNAVIAGNRRKYLLATSGIPITFSRHEHLSGKVLDKSLPLESSNWRGLNRNQRQTAILKMLNDGDLVVRPLTPVECERLQTTDDNYTALGNFNGKVKPISKTQRYKMLGNGFTVDVIAHILSHIPQIKSGEWL